MSDLNIREADGRVRFQIRIQPRASRSEVVGVYGDALKVRISSPPVDGAANAELVEFLARIFAVPRRSVRILAGETSRSKLVEIDGVTARAVVAVAQATER